jgi:hypothetical protein
MESVWEKEIRELLDSLNRVPIEELLRSISEEPIPFTDRENVSMPRRTRRKKKAF